MAVSLKLGPHFLRLLPFLRVEGLAEEAPLMVHLGDMVVDVALLFRLHLVQLLLRLVSLLLDGRDGSLSRLHLSLHELRLRVLTDHLVGGLEDLSHAHEAHVSAGLGGLASDGAIGVLDQCLQLILLLEHVGGLVVKVRLLLDDLFGRRGLLQFLLVELGLRFIKNNGIHRRSNFSHVIVAVDHIEHFGVPLLVLTLHVDLLILLELEESFFEPGALCGLSVNKDEAVVLAVMMMSMVLGLRRGCKQKRNYKFHCY